MTTRDARRRARQRLDARLAALPPATEYAPPRSGWVRAVREALGMSLADLGRRLDVTAPTVQALERSEQAGKAQLDTLRRAAEALDCTLVYAFVPNSSLQHTLEQQAERVVTAQAAAAQHSMALENQACELSPAAHRALVDKLVQGGRVWSAP